MPIKDINITLNQGDRPVSEFIEVIRFLLNAEKAEESTKEDPKTEAELPSGLTVDFPFESAVAYLKKGFTVSRKAWSGRCLAMPAVRIRNPESTVCNSFYRNHGILLEVCPLSLEDILAEDWYIAK